MTPTPVAGKAEAPSIAGGTPHVADHLSIFELKRLYRTGNDTCPARHFQAICLWAHGHTIEEVAGRYVSRATLDRGTAGPLQRAGPAVLAIRRTALLGPKLLAIPAFAPFSIS